VLYIVHASRALLTRHSLATQGAAATGDGDQMMRFLPSFAAVGYMRAGDSPTAACAKALQPIAKYYPAASGGLVCLNAQVGRPAQVLSGTREYCRVLGSTVGY
jgi:hypothetical protein